MKVFNDLSLDEKFDLIIRTYKIDEQIEALDILYLFYNSKPEDGIEIEIGKDKIFITAVNEFLSI